MKYYVYENWVAEKKAKIHNAFCGFCKHGRGHNPRHVHGESNGKWHGSFKSYEEARRFALTRKDRKVSDCMSCIAPPE